MKECMEEKTERKTKLSGQAVIVSDLDGRHRGIKTVETKLAMIETTRLVLGMYRAFMKVP